MTVQTSAERFIASVQEALRNYDTQLQNINQQIWSNPELAYEEHQAHDAICTLFDTLSTTTDFTFTIQRSAYDIPTAFEITYTHGDPSRGRVVAFNAEYDALPGIGHACGHNLIATSSIAAFLATCHALRSAATTASASDAAAANVTVKLLGTPAEESGGGKIQLLERGAYQGVHACLMVHPVPMAPQNPRLLTLATVLPGGYLANDKLRVTFTGKPAHAAAAPWEGVNALDAVVAAYVNVSLLRQQILPTQRVHGVIVHGGERPNVIPRSASVDYYIRSPTVKSLKGLSERVVKCFEAAAVATGCEVAFEWGPSYADLKTNNPICESYVAVMRAMGHLTLFDNTGQKSAITGASTDQGNVSYAVPGFHGIFTIPTDGVNHTPGFTKGAGSLEAYQRGMACAAGMAVVACQVLVDDEFAARVQKDFEMERE
ncbi:metal-dependent amidase/aminoacylase/carboxypeptidase [Aspergillus japonicus CBS 114.51]|uniref:Peptidase M20 domain-containing protein 2 n=1 Tax=Aspergillus japonicus CBS 114.51 TaxID=1448312 RepID=A0A8T8XFN8_ASPJA|nr:metal-dependent amidase/aminoacylase/carboxypeptidase [Aspergillus japonicus CBS 114.51]RAH86159.1 metal-dependent amidase/aminoacylase/carboxypeptidase [Aspergillus japonicus CBS 114.51]